MAKIHFIEADKTKISVEASAGTLMELAIANGIDGIENSCGGLCSCATCHVHIAKQSLGLVGERSEQEEDMLEFEENVTNCSRLSCQIEVTESLDGLVVEAIAK